MDNQQTEITLQEKMVIEEKKQILKPQCLKDSHIMEYFIKRGIQGEELAELNKLQIHLKSTCL